MAVIIHISFIHIDFLHEIEGLEASSKEKEQSY